MNIKAFFVDALQSALELNIAQPEDVLRHVTPDVLAQHLPRPLWARLLAACLGAPKVDARLIVETIGVPNLCEHVPAPIIWSCIADVASRSLGTSSDAAVAAPMRTTASGRAVLAPPPEASMPAHTPASGAPVSSMGPRIPSPNNEPLSDLISELEQQNGDEPRAAGTGQVRPRSPTATRFRQSNTAAGRPGGLGSASRRPQAMATPVPVRPTAPPRRHGTELTPDPEPETAVQGDWGSKEIAVDDSQLVDWQTDVGSSSAITGDDDFSDLGGRKR